MLKGAMAELVIGDPAQFSSDLGPVIDAAARTNLLAHIETHHFDVIAQCALSTACEHGHFVAPTVIRLRQIEDLRRAVFGPVLHVATFKSGELELAVRSEERRVGKECVSTFSSRWSAYHTTTNT